MNFYSQGRSDARKITAIPGLIAGMMPVLDMCWTVAMVGRFTETVQHRHYWAGFRDQMVAQERSPAEQSAPLVPGLGLTNPNVNTTMLETAIQSLADAINNLANRLPASLTSVSGAAGKTTPTTPATGTPATGAAKPGATAPAGAKGGNADALAKARAAAAAKREQEKADAAAAAGDLDGAGDDLSLLDGGGDAGEVGTVTMEDLRAVGMEILKAKKQKDMAEVLKGLGAASISALDPSKYDEALPLLQGILM